MSAWSALILVAISAPAAEIGPNLLPNGGFEQGPWREENDIRPAEADLMVSHGGGQSMRLAARPDAERHVYGPAFDLDPAKTYLLTAWVKCEGVTDPNGAQVWVLQWSDREPVGWVWNWSLGQGVKELTRTGGTHGWKRFAVLLTKLDPRAKRGAPFLSMAPGSGTAWLDDVTVREWTGGPLPPPLEEPAAKTAPPPPPRISLPAEFDLQRLTFPPRRTSGPSSLQNGGFEQPPPTDWCRTAVLDLAVKHGGEASLALGVADSGMIASAPGVNPDRDYRLSAWIRTEGVPEAGLTLRLWPGWWNEATMGETLLVADGTRDWTRREIVLRNLPQSLRGQRWWLYYALKPPAPGEPTPRAWLDDVELAPLADSVRVTSSKLGHLFVEGEPAKLTYVVRDVPPGETRRLRWAAADFWGNLADQGQADLGAPAEITLPGRGYWGLALVLEDGSGHPLQGETVSAAVLPKPPTEAGARRPESIFACWGVPPELAPPLGVKWTRWIERGGDFTPLADQPEQFTWNLKQYYGDYRPHEARVQEQRAGLTTYLCFAGFGDWMLRGADGARAPVPRDWGRFADWVAFVYRQVADVVPVVEVWNEPVIPWGWEGTPEDIVALHRTVYETVKRINPKAIVLGPCDSTEHLDTFGRLGGFRYVDAVSIHPYRQSSPEATDFVGELRRVKAIAAQYGGEKPVWITEMGWTTAPGRFTELEQANWIARAYLLAMGEGVRSLNVHIFADWNNSSASEKYYGITRTDRTPKPAAVAYATLTRNLEGARFVRRIEGLGRASFGSVFERDGKPLLVLWNAGCEGAPAKLRVGVETVAVEQLDGKVESARTKAGQLEIELGGSPLFVRGAAREMFLTPGR